MRPSPWPERRGSGLSMRPWRIRPGKTYQRRTAPRVASACFNEAGADPPRKVRPDDDGPGRPRYASMRPGRIRPGKRFVHPAARQFNPVASMRPGRIRPGKKSPEVLAYVERELASMRPGRIRPGKDRATGARRRRRRLRFNEAGADPPRKGRHLRTATPPERRRLQ